MPDRIEPFRSGSTRPRWRTCVTGCGTTRWPEREPVGDWSQGVPLGYLQDLCGYWAERVRLAGHRGPVNEIPQFTTDDRRPGHPLPARPLAASRRVPLIMTHGWPGSFLEFERGPRPAGRPGRPRRRPGRRVPRGGPVAAGLRLQRQACRHRLGHSPHRPRLGRADDPPGLRRFRAAGSDWGTSVSTSLALQHPGRVLGIHLVPPLAPPDRDRRRPHRRRARRAGRPRPAPRTGSGYSADPGHPAPDHRLRADRLAGRPVRLDRGEAVGRGPTTPATSARS